MRLSEPRVPALEREQWDADAQDIMSKFGDGEPFNIFKTLCNHPQLMRRWLVFANHILGKSTLPPREREILILRIGWLCQAGYEWGQHVLIGRDCGLTDDEIQAIKAGPDAESWSDADRALLRAVDELHADAHISDATWSDLAQTWSTEQLMDLVFTVGQYNLVSMALNTLGVQPDRGLPRLED
ncbi:MAG: carboxymuconolactone decarboxylase family protein [Gammaproteobacteria bacterium]|nr:MAG: carboxymuconolactone decarboxylase family protein [Gammaproteobacteria bacterium]